MIKKFSFIILASGLVLSACSSDKEAEDKNLTIIKKNIWSIKAIVKHQKT